MQRREEAEHEVVEGAAAELLLLRVGVFCRGSVYVAVAQISLRAGVFRCRRVVRAMHGISRISGICALNCLL